MLSHQPWTARPTETSRVNGVSDLKMVTPDGQTIEGRIGELCASIAYDIARCGNACAEYRKLVSSACHLAVPNCKSGRGS